MSEQLLRTRPVFGLHEDAAKEVPRVFGDVGGQLGVGGLSGDLKYGRHGLVFSPRGLFCQHLHHSAAKTPVYTTYSLRLMTPVRSHDIVYLTCHMFSSTAY